MEEYLKYLVTTNIEFPVISLKDRFKSKSKVKNGSMSIPKAPSRCKKSVCFMCGQSGHMSY